MVIGTIADTLTRSVENVTGTLSETFIEPTLRLGVTGLSRAGKTVFITSLVANLMDRARMPQLVAESESRILSAFLQPQPDDTLPRFDYETHLAALTARAPHWPDSTRAVSELRLSLKIRPSGLLSGLQGPRTLHLDIVDYPGEWLLDLSLLDKSYADWSRDMLDRLALRPGGPETRTLLESEDSTQDLDETRARLLSDAYTAALHTARNAGFSDCSPGRFLLPGELEGSPVLTFAPLPPVDSAPRRSLYREFERRFDSYKARVVKPFFRDHFSRIDRQIVLVDALGAIHAGPRAMEDLRRTLAEILTAFRPGTNAFLTNLFMGKRVEKILFAATKADHLHHLQHGRLTAIMEALTREARDRARFAGAETQAMSLAALRATTEQVIQHQGSDLPCVRGTLLETGKQAAFYPGALPEDPSHLLGTAREGAENWLDQDYSVMNFAPAPLVLKPGEGPPHIRLDRAAQFLIGDKL
ncbi:YcjX-like protein [Antarctobacter heliothermus]|uniref:YcjX-like protein n=1 Tax=Antarctobacter heliothermus TaxID=74033 RepID=A0A222EAG1_9RHOB|nr:YcjX family protein [Antarctobacter heliothermus]ASP23152.1 YcjX-like protein [Antarctobacter heliothermus]